MYDDMPVDNSSSTIRPSESFNRRNQCGVALVAVLCVAVILGTTNHGHRGSGEDDASGTRFSSELDCSGPTAQAVLHSCGGPPAESAWDVGSGQYADRRLQALAIDASDMVGSEIVLTTREITADRLLRDARSADLADSPALPTVHFFDAKERYDASRTLPFVRAVSPSANSSQHWTCTTSMGTASHQVLIFH